MDGTSKLTNAAWIAALVASSSCGDSFVPQDDGTPVDVTVAGCADGTREAFTDTDAEPDIAGCSGGFNIAGVTTQASTSAQCARAAGNDGKNPSGAGCSVEDLCGQGWHVCAASGELQTKARAGGCSAVSPDTFWVTRQAEDPSGLCVAGGENNLVGCGADNVGRPAPPNCAPLTRELRYLDCESMATWSCGNSASANSEASLVVKPGPAGGGAICCRD